MIWIDDIKSLYLGQDIYSDIAYNLDTIILGNSLSDVEVEACCLASAVACGYYGLWQYIYKNYSTDLTHRQAALAAAQAMIVYNQHEFVRNTIAVAYAQSKIRNRALNDSGAVSAQQYDLYRLAAALAEQNTDATTTLGKQCMNSGYSNLHIADANRIVTVIKILGKVLPDSLK